MDDHQRILTVVCFLFSTSIERKEVSLKVSECAVRLYGRRLSLLSYTSIVSNWHI